MFKPAERKKSQGFTLVEFLIVVAIIGILLAVAIPSVISYYRSLKLTELDDSARSIFMAAQNRLTAMKSAGEDLYALSIIEVNEHAAPDAGTGRFFAVTSEQAESLASLVPGGSIESKLHDNHYVVEIDPKTGAVYAVWYWEKDNFDYVNESYDEVKPEKDKRLDAGRMVGYYGGSFVDRPTIGQTPMPSAQVINAEELKLKISVPGFADGTSAAIKANVTISAGGKTVPIVPDVLGSQGVDLVYDPYNNVFEGEIALDTLDESKYTSEASAAKWSVGKSFKNWAKDLTTGTYAIAPGANFDIEVKVTAVGTSGSTDPVNYLPQHLYWTDVNSLFESVDETTGTANIAYGRHLQNLDSETSGVTDTITAAEQTREIDFAATNPDNTKPENNIFYWASTYEKTGSAPAYRAFVPIRDRVDYDGQSLPIRNLYSESAGGLFGKVNDGTGTAVEWNNIVLIDTRVNTAAAQVGALAGQVTNAHITNCQVYLENPTQYSDPDHLTPEPWLETTGNVIGGLVGQVQGDGNTITGSFAATVISGDTNVGGLVGSMYTGSKLDIDHSYAACHLTATKTIGGAIHVSGLVGNVNFNATLSVTNCYAAGVITGGNSVAGLVNRQGTGTNITIKNSYAAVRYGDLQSGATVYGTAEPSSGSFTTTGDHVYYVAQSGIDYKDSFGTKVSTKDLSEMPATGTTGIPADANTLGGDWYQLPAEKTETVGGVTTETTNPLGAAFPYKQTEETKDLSTPYPYPQLLMRDADGRPITNSDGENLPKPHYGDWLEAEEAGALMVYFEKYREKDSANNRPATYGFYALELTEDSTGAVTVTEKPLLNTLHSDATDRVSLDGYLLVSPVELSADTKYKIDGITYSNTAPASAPAPLKPADTALTAALTTALTAQDGFEEYKNVYTFHTDDTPVNDLYHALELNGQTFYYNPHFACEAYTVQAGAAAPAKPTTWLAKPGAGGKENGTGTAAPDPADPYAESVVVRSPRHLAFMAAYTNGDTSGTVPAVQAAARGWSYHQLLNMYYSYYDAKSLTAGGTVTSGGYANQSVGRSNNPQHPAYLEGGSYDGHDHYIEGIAIGARISSGKAVDSNVGLFGTLTGNATVQNITFDVSDIIKISTTVSTVGMLAGHTEGSTHITNCTSIDSWVMAEKSSKTGALVGDAAGSTEITSCGAHTIDTSQYVARTITGGATVGGLIGMVGSGTKVNNCYAAVKVSGKTNVGGFAGQINGSAGMSDCYAGGNAAGYFTTGKYYINVTATDANGRAGGFVGLLKNSEEVKTNKYELKSFTLSGTLYSTCSVKGKETGLFAARVEDGTELYGLSGSSIKDTLKAATVYGIGVAFDEDGNRAAPTKADTEKQYFAPATVILKQVKAVTTTPYNPTFCTPPYPYATGTTQTTHHGDWPDFEGAFYWEKENGTYHYSVHAALGDAIFVESYSQGSALCIDRHAGAETLNNKITDWGYGLFSNAADAASQLSSAANGFAAADNSAAAKGALTADFKAAYPATTVVMVKPAEPTATSSFYSSFELTRNSNRYFELNRRFADAIDVVYARNLSKPTNMGKDKTHAYQIRTVQQLDCIPNGDSAHYVQTHDLYGQGSGNSTLYPGNNGQTYAYNGAGGGTYDRSFLGEYDGSLYRILELSIGGDPSKTDAAGLFVSTYGTLENIILYSPSGKATITADKDESQQKAAGLAAVAGGTIRNCIVAGYTIKTVGDVWAVGGLVADAGNLTIQNCAAVNDIVCTDAVNVTAGGLVGFANATPATCKLENCYAGGAITAEIDAESTKYKALTVGGILGKSNFVDAVYVNVYSYMDLLKLPSESSVNSFECYAIGPQASSKTPNYTYCYYWSLGLPKGKTPADPAGADVTPCTLTELAELGTDTDDFTSTFTGDDAAHTFVPVEGDATKGLTDKNGTNPYPFPAVVRELDADGEATGDYVHYGEWPVYEGIFYWELEDGVYHFSVHTVTHTAAGYIKSTDGSDLSGLCTDHHAEADTLEHKITAWGYGLYSNKVGADLNKLSVDSSSNAQNAGDKFRETYRDAAVAMVEPAVPDDTYDHYRSFQITSGTGPWFELNRRYADAIDVVDTQKSDDPTKMGTESMPYYIRTVQQLDCIPEDPGADYDKNAYYVQTHDLYGQGPDGSAQYYGSRTEGNNGPTYAYYGASSFQGTYDGRLYRILELSIDCENNVTKYAGLFESTVSATLKNIILYSPSGKAKIVAAAAANVGAANAGGLVAEASSTSSTIPTKISNCVVAGYTITVPGRSSGSSYGAGGLVGSAVGSLNVENCAAVNNIVIGERMWAGGLVGKRNTASDATLTFTNCYAGGSITLTATERYVGGIVGYRGYDTEITCTNVYSYVKMTGDASNTFSGIAPAYSGRSGTTIRERSTSFTNCYYWSGGLPADVTPADGLADEPSSTNGLTACKLADLTKLKTTTGNDFYGSGAQHTFVPDTDGTHADTVRVENGLTDKNPADPYPYPAVVRELDENGEATGDYVHYGEWYIPNISAAFYWEKEQVYSWNATQSKWVADGEPEYRYHLMGVSELSKKTDKSLDVDTLCTDRHDDGKIHQIDRYGYGVLTTGDGTQTKKWGGESCGMESPVIKTSSFTDDEKAVQALIEKELGTFTSYFGVYQCDKELSHEYNQYMYNLSIPGAPTRTVYFTIDFADLYKTVKGDDNNTFTIRAARQLDNIINDTPNTYEQAHDVGAVGYNVYTAPDIRNVTYKGEYYRILELSIKSSEDVALFKIARGTNRLENMVLYSPSGKARIEATNDQKAAGGLIAYLDIGAGYNTTIENCAVAGYTIYTPRNTAGGLVGYANHDLTISRCEAVNTFDRRYDDNISTKDNPLGIGGLVGPVGNDVDAYPSLTIQNSYAGGLIGGNSTVGSVGGLYGGGRAPTTLRISNAYSYMDLSSCWMDTSNLTWTDRETVNTRKEVNTIGHGAPVPGSSLYYYNKSSYLPRYEKKSDHNQDYRIQGIPTTSLGSMPFGGYPAKSYVPGNVGLTDKGQQTSLKAVVKDADGKYVHYGKLPTP